MTFCRAEEKYDILKKNLEDYEFILVHLNPRIPSVVVPEKHSKSLSLTLKLSYNFSGSMSLTKDLITADLLFDGDFFTCEIPLSAVWGTTTPDNQNSIWPENISPESFASMASQISSLRKAETPQETEEINEPPPSTAKKPTLKRIK